MPRPSAPRILLALGLVALALSAFAAPAGAAAPRIIPAAEPGNVVCTLGPSLALTARDGRIQTPDGNSVYMWGYASTAGRLQIPGPVLCVTEGDTVTVTLTNNLPALNTPGEPGPDAGPPNTSLVFPGQLGVISTDPTPGLLAGEADPGGTVTYTFTAGRPGTYLYESGTEPSRQVEMGLYGAIIVRPALGPDFAYNDPTTQFNPDREYILILHDIDPALHHAVDRGQAFDITKKHDRYWTVNGRSFPDSISDSGVPWLPNQPYGALVWVEPFHPVDNPLPALVRYANAGLSNHPFHPHGNHLRVIARDGALLTGPAGQDGSMEAFTKTIGSGQTYDLLVRFDDDEGYSLADPVQFQGTDVVFPGLLNLVFKDDLSFYSGSPYLGEEDELPPALTRLNECGEFYYPWHSHALNEFQNFDEGFGGLATLLRVDPPGGCGITPSFASAPAAAGAPAKASGPAPGAAPASAQPSAALPDAARPKPARSRRAVSPAVSVRAKVRGRTVTFRASARRCSPCKARLRLKARGPWRTLPMRRSGKTFVAVVRRLPAGLVTYYVTARDLDSGRRWVSARQRIRVGPAPVIARPTPPTASPQTPVPAAPPPVGPAQVVVYDLCADEGTITLPGGVLVPIWGFSLGSGGSCAPAQLPGPMLEAVAGDIVTINLTNNLDTENVSLVFPGQTLPPDTVGVAPGATASYTFTAASSGAFLYETGVNTQIQLPMGLYGAFVVRPLGSPGQAYPDPSTAFDVERALVLSEIDTDLNAAPDTFAPLDWDPEYWLLNGEAYPETDAIVATPGQRVLLRYLNAGQDHHTMTLLGMRQRVIARDAFQPVVTPDLIAETIASGSAVDAIATVPASGASFPIYSRQLNLTNGPTFPGGMLTFVTVP
jgi:FtsP/CotA-like multicopper oxidase with cupredoxin domain